MPPLKIERIISFSSEDKVHVAKNLLGNNTSLKWKCASAGAKNATICFQLQEASLITGIDIGNEHSSYIEVLVSRSAEMENDYKSFLVMSSFMSAIESRHSTNINRVRMFKREDFSKPECDERWDRIKVVCTQPFNRHVQYGLSFIKFHSNTVTEKEKSDVNGEIKLGKFTLRPESPIDFGNGSLFARRKELKAETENKPLSAAAAIRAATSSLLNNPNSSPIRQPKTFLNNLRNSASKTETKLAPSETTPKARNRNELFYTEDEEKPHPKIDKLIERKNAEKLKLKEEEDKNSPQSKKKIKKTDEEKAKPEKEKITKPAVHSRDKPAVDKAEKESSKRKLQEAEVKSPKKVKHTKISKPFNKLLEDVVLVISGIQNPTRATLRGKILEMGAKYKPDWDSTCTHLVCAFMNTPKFNQVKGIGKIVTSQWVDECYSQRKKLPWRRYALDKQEKKKDESEDEIWETITKVRSPSPEVEDTRQGFVDEALMEQASDTEDIIEQIKRTTPQGLKNGLESTPTKNKDSTPSQSNLAHSSKKKETNIPMENKNKVSPEPTPHCSKDNLNMDVTEIKPSPKNGEESAVYTVDTDTDEETVERKQQVKKKPFDFFKNKAFFIDSSFEDDVEEMLKNYIFIHEGSLLDDPLEDIDYIICGKEEAPNLSSVNTKAICVLPDWIVDCHRCRQFIPPDEYFVL